MAALSPDVENYTRKAPEIKNKIPLSEIGNLPLYFFEIAGELKEISGTWDPVTFYTATNAREERARFLADFKHGDAYNPNFEYANADIYNLETKREKIYELLHRVRNPELGIPNARDKGTRRLERLARAALYFKLKDDLATIDLVEGLRTRDENKIKVAMKTKYPGLTHPDGKSQDEFLLNLARESYEYHTSKEVAEQAKTQATLTPEEIELLEKPNMFSASDIKEAIEWIMDQYGILQSENNPNGFPVITDATVTSITVLDKRLGGPAVLVPSDRKMDGKTLLYTIAHEVEGHAIQSFNGQKLFGGLGGGALKVDDEMLYEGLGMRYQAEVLRELFGEETPMPLPFYTYAVKAAEDRKSFYEIFSEQVDMRLHQRLKIHPDMPLPDLSEIEERDYNTALDQAWLTTYRVMRGHADTTNPLEFAMAKDLAYLRGWAIDRQLIQNGVGYLNDSGVIASGALQLLAELDLKEEDLPIKYRNLAPEYWYKILKPKYFTSDESS